MIETSKVWGMPGLSDNYFILKRTTYRGHKLFEALHHTFQNKSGTVIHRSANLLEVFAALKTKYSDHLQYAEKRNTFARKATPKQVAYIMSMIGYKLSYYMQTKRIDIPREEFEEHVAEVLKNEKQAIICKFIFALRLGDNDYEKLKCAQVVNNAVKRLHENI